MSKVGDNAHYYVAGAGLYYGLSWVFTFYPAFIIGLFACQQTDPTLCDPYLIGLVVMVIGWVTLLVLYVLDKWELLITFYVLTLWPFLHQIYWYFVHIDSGPGGTDECFPLPPVDWWPFW